MTEGRSDINMGSIVGEWRDLAGQAFSRAAGAPLIEGNSIRLLRNAAENYPAWLEAIAGAKRHVHLESYIFAGDRTGKKFAEALVAKAREGVRVRVIYDWVGCFAKTSGKFWKSLQDGGVEIRCFNRPRWDDPLGWFSRDHRKMLEIDGRVGYVTGLCIGEAWEGIPEKKIEPWRDTGVEVRGPAVSDIGYAFAQVWAMTGKEIPKDEYSSWEDREKAGESRLRIVAGIPSTARMFRTDQLVAALAKERLWLTDPYYAGTSTYVQALRELADDGVDVRLLVPHGTDIPLIRPLSRSGYRTLLEAGIRIFEWNGTMLHAKTAVADGIWARVGSTNLNVSSWLGNCELDVVAEDELFARKMEAAYLEDLENATEVVLDRKLKVRAPGAPRHPRHFVRKGSGSVGRAAAGAVRIGNVVGAAFTNRRVLEPVESRVMVLTGVALFLLCALFVALPVILAYPLILVFLWMSVVLVSRGIKLRRGKNRHAAEDVQGTR